MCVARLSEEVDGFDFAFGNSIGKKQFLICPPSLTLQPKIRLTGKSGDRMSGELDDFDFAFGNSIGKKQFLI
jgi:hypothetical protein